LSPFLRPSFSIDLIALRRLRRDRRSLAEECKQNYEQKNSFQFSVFSFQSSIFSFQSSAHSFVPVRPEALKTEN
jgi:hypothetical protein